MSEAQGHDCRQDVRSVGLRYDGGPVYTWQCTVRGSTWDGGIGGHPLAEAASGMDRVTG